MTIQYSVATVNYRGAAAPKNGRISIFYPYHAFHDQRPSSNYPQDYLKPNKQSN